MVPKPIWVSAKASLIIDGNHNVYFIIFFRNMGVTQFLFRYINNQEGEFY